MVEKLTYVDVESRSQTVLWEIFKKDEGFKKLTTNVLDKEPEGFNKGTGYPIFIIPLPSVEDNILGFRKHGLVLYFNCALYTLTIPVMRTMEMASKGVIVSNRNVLRSYGLDNPTVECRTSPFPLDDGRMAYRSDVIIRVKAALNGSPDD